MAFKIVFGDPANIRNVMVTQGNHRFPNLGILYLISYLKNKMPTPPTMMYLKGDIPLSNYIDALQADRPDVFGISFSSWVSDIAYETIEAVRKAFPHIPIICGGTHATACPDEVLNKTSADICVIGEGEQTMMDLASHFAGRGPSLSSISGIAYKEGSTVLKTNPRPAIADLGSIPMPDWDLIDFKNYPGLGYCKASPNTAMTFARGCPYNCVYCSNPVWRANKPWLRMRPADDIVREISYLYEKKGIREIWIRADEFNCDVKWSIDVCKAIVKLGYKDLFFEGNLRVDKVPEELVISMREMNFWMVNLGIETMNQRVLDGIKKRTTVEQVHSACALLKKHNIQVYAWLMMYQIWEEDGKLCVETPAEVDNTLTQVRKLAKNGLIDLMSWQIATPIQGSSLYDIALRHGLIRNDFSIDVWRPGMVLPGVSEKQIQWHRIKGQLLQAYLAYKKGRITLSKGTVNSIIGRSKYLLEAIWRYGVSSLHLGR